MTPDSLGPKVINEIDVTRHLINYLPQYVEEGTRPVFVQGIFFHSISHIRAWNFQQNKKRTITHSFIKGEVYIQDGHLAD